MGHGAEKRKECPSIEIRRKDEKRVKKKIGVAHPGSATSTELSVPVPLIRNDPVAALRKDITSLHILAGKSISVEKKATPTITKTELEAPFAKNSALVTTPTISTSTTARSEESVEVEVDNHFRRRSRSAGPATAAAAILSTETRWPRRNTVRSGTAADRRSRSASGILVTDAPAPVSRKGLSGLKEFPRRTREDAKKLSQATPTSSRSCVKCAAHEGSRPPLTLQVNKSGNQSSTTPFRIPKFRALDLPVTLLSFYIELRLNFLLPVDAKPLRVRVLSNHPSAFAVQNHSQQFFRELKISNSFPYNSRMLAVFQETEKEGEDIMFLTLYLQEYGSDCPPPNKNKIYISVVDSVQLFQPSCHRTLVYQMTMLYYFKYMRGFGFEAVFFWAWPPLGDAEYFFHRRPSHQRNHKPNTLAAWYVRLMKLGVAMKVFNMFSTQYEWFQEIKTPLEFFLTFPIFKEDYWEYQLEMVVLQIKIENEEAAAAAARPPSRLQLSRMSKAKKKSILVKSKKLMTNPETRVLMKLRDSIMRNKKNFFRIELAKSSEANPVDQIVISKLANRRDKCLEYFVENELEFSDILKAKLATKRFISSVILEAPSRHCDLCERPLLEGIYCGNCQVTLCTECNELSHHNQRNVKSIFCLTYLGRLSIRNIFPTKSKSSPKKQKRKRSKCKGGSTEVIPGVAHHIKNGCTQKSCQVYRNLKKCICRTNRCLLQNDQLVRVPKAPPLDQSSRIHMNAFRALVLFHEVRKSRIKEIEPRNQ